MGFPGASAGKESACNVRDLGSTSGWEGALEKGKATHSSILAWKIPWTIAHQAPLSMGFPRQEYYSGLPFPSPGDLPDLGNEPEFLEPPALAGRFFTTAPLGKPKLS